MTDRPPPRRSRDAQDSRARLLDAARVLFAERGYERATVRDIGRAADVDPALIARYFGSKAALYVESFRPAGAVASQTPTDLTDPAALRRVFERFGPAEPTPALHAAIRPHADEEIQAAAMAVLVSKLVEPLEARANAADLDRPRLRAEVAVAALAGVVISRSSKSLQMLAEASPDELAGIVAGLIDAVLSD